ncbi:MAG: PAS domain-containing protein, partial [Halobacteriaceae archaeon]
MLGENCRFLQGEDTDPETVATISEAIDAEESVSVEILNYRKDGTPFWNQLDIVPVTDGEGEVTHFLGLQRDITARKAR